MVPRLLPGSHESPEAGFHGVIGTFTKRPSACRLHGSLTPAWFSRGRPHCLRRVWACHAQRAADCGWTGVSLSPLPVIAAPGAARRSQRVVCRSLPEAGHGAAAEVAHAHRNDNGNVSDEWTIRLSGSPVGSRTRRGEGCPSIIFLTKSHFCSPSLCRIYKLFTIWVLRYQRSPSLYSRRERPKY